MRFAVGRVDAERRVADVQRLADVVARDVRAVVVKRRRRVGVHEVVVVVRARDVVEVVGVGPDVAVEHLVPDFERAEEIALLDLLDGRVAILLDLRLLRDARDANVPEELGIARDHVDRVDPAVADRDARQRHLGVLLFILFDDLGAERRHVVAAVALAGNVEIGIQFGREDLVELRQERVEVPRDAVFRVGAVVVVRIGEGEAGADGVVDEEHVVGHGPRRLARRQQPVRVDRERAHLREESEHGRAARAALEPN
mmetsp:Transcript_15034/g.45055  ORF Transcript_15034/g.45055 Transcript_15034/m.45055 type:complete len:256 (+) Transcript_15034:423-1190(+)